MARSLLRDNVGTALWNRGLNDNEIAQKAIRVGYEMAHRGLAERPFYELNTRKKSMKISRALLIACSMLPLHAQVVLDSVSMSGRQTTSAFSWTHTTGNAANRALVVALGTRDHTAVSVTYGGVPLARLTACADPQYVSHNAEIWALPAGTQPASGAATITVTLNGTPRFAGAVSYSLSNVDQTKPVDQVACHENPYGTYFLNDSLTVTNTYAHDFMIGTITIPDTGNAANMTNWPGTEDINYSCYDVGVYSHSSDTGPAGAATYAWTWRDGQEPDAAAVVTLQPVASAPPALPPPGSVSYLIGPLSSRPATCPATATGLIFYVAKDMQTLSWCAPGMTSWVSGSGLSASSASIQQCTGSGTGWNCQGMLAVMAQKSDGSLVQIVGVSAPLPVSPGITWSPL